MRFTKLKKLQLEQLKILVRDDQFDPPVEMLEEQFGKMSRSLEVLYEGVLGIRYRLFTKMGDG
jgi:hypothetical protein